MTPGTGRELIDVVPPLLPLRAEAAPPLPQWGVDDGGIRSVDDVVDGRGGAAVEPVEDLDVGRMLHTFWGIPYVEHHGRAAADAPERLIEQFHGVASAKTVLVTRAVRVPFSVRAGFGLRFS